MTGLFRFFRSRDGSSGEQKESFFVRIASSNGRGKKKDIVVDSAETEVLDDPLEGHDRYERLMAINSGTFGFVMKAADRVTSKPVAIKFLPRGAKLCSSVEREILNHKALRHPHVIQFKEAFVTEKYLAIVMEYADQGDLFRYVQAHGRLREDVARWIFQQLIFGLDYCHRKGVANRDIKLENILLQSGARRPFVKLCDFGYSKHDEWDSAPTSRVGTPDYMSPEILRSRGGRYDAKKADLWSCGVVLFVMVVGQYPFSHKNDSQFHIERQHKLVLDRILELNYVVPPFVPAPCADLIQRLLDPSPITRITIQEIIEHPWHKIGLPPTAANMNDVYMTVTPDTSQSDEEIKECVRVGMRPAGDKLIDSDSFLDEAIAENCSSFEDPRAL